MISFNQIGYLGRLGNQMFQFASTLGIAERINCEAKFPLENCFFDAPAGPIDPSSLKNSKIKCNLIDCFEINPTYFIPKNHIKNLSLFREGSFEYDANSEKIQDYTDLIGYFQTEKYFAHCKDLIISQFKFKESFRRKAFDFISSVKDKNQHSEVVSIHIRRGDYVMYPDHHPVCSDNYYRESINLAKKKWGKETIFIVFSDDPEWCKNEFSEQCFIVSNLNDPFIEMCAMSMCNHNIIANSSFSWWGAWLNTNNQKTIISPKRWFGPLLNKNTKDLYGQNWIQL